LNLSQLTARLLFPYSSLYLLLSLGELAMPLLTEEALRSMRLPQGQRELNVAPGTVCSPSALDYLASCGIALVFTGQPTAGNSGKPEHLTHLRGDELVPKNHPLIAFRGEMDMLFAMLAESAAVCSLSCHEKLCDELTELLAFSRQILQCEVTGEAFTRTELLGYSLDEYHAMSHDPKKYFGIGHPTPHPGMGAAALRLNTIRTQVRRAELAAARVFICVADVIPTRDTKKEAACGAPARNNTPQVIRADIITALNRLSSVVYVLFCRELAS
jgi:ethanolamine utilization cobalamin adenosyltransferase